MILFGCYRWRLRFVARFAWCDLRVGVFWDRGGRVLYVCPLPTLVLEFWSREGHPWR